MGPEEFFFFMFGMVVGAIIVLMIQSYGRRKVKKALEGGSAPHIDDSSARNVALLASENERQQGQILRLEDRLKVLERIATDSPARLAESIDALR